MYEERDKNLGLHRTELHDKELPDKELKDDVETCQVIACTVLALIIFEIAMWIIFGVLFPPKENAWIVQAVVIVLLLATGFFTAITFMMLADEELDNEERNQDKKLRKNELGNNIDVAPYKLLAYKILVTILYQIAMWICFGLIFPPKTHEWIVLVAFIGLFIATCVVAVSAFMDLADKEFDEEFDDDTNQSDHAQHESVEKECATKNVKVFVVDNNSELQEVIKREVSKQLDQRMAEDNHRK